LKTLPQLAIPKLVGQRDGALEIALAHNLERAAAASAGSGR